MRQRHLTFALLGGLAGLGSTLADRLPDLDLQSGPAPVTTPSSFAPEIPGRPAHHNRSARSFRSGHYCGGNSHRRKSPSVTDPSHGNRKGYLKRERNRKRRAKAAANLVDNYVPAGTTRFFGQEYVFTPGAPISARLKRRLEASGWRVAEPATNP